MHSSQVENYESIVLGHKQVPVRWRERNRWI
jgi:hypothetical protein